VAACQDSNEGGVPEDDFTDAIVAQYIEERAHLRKGLLLSDSFERPWLAHYTAFLDQYTAELTQQRKERKAARKKKRDALGEA